MSVGEAIGGVVMAVFKKEKYLKAKDTLRFSFRVLSGGRTEQVFLCTANNRRGRRRRRPSWTYSLTQHAELPIYKLRLKKCRHIILSAAVSRLVPGTAISTDCAIPLM
jgi:hypothetical protein